MSDWVVAATLTLAASVHCVGMCGGFVLAITGPGRTAPLALVGRQLLLQLGKATTYAFLGALAGALGASLLQGTALAWTGRGLSVVAAVAIALAGLTLLGWRGTRGDGVAAWIAPVWNRVVGPLLVSRPRGSALVVGLAMGFLPCPLVYAGLAAAVAGGSPLFGASVMAGVALGTVPALTLVGFVSSLRPRRLGVVPVRLAGALLLVAAALTLARGLGAGHAHRAAGPDATPAAHSH